MHKDRATCSRLCALEKPVKKGGRFAQEKKKKKCPEVHLVQASREQSTQKTMENYLLLNMENSYPRTTDTCETDLVTEQTARFKPSKYLSGCLF